MKAKEKRILFWIIAAAALLLAFIIIKNWNGFIDGFNSGSVVG